MHTETKMRGECYVFKFLRRIVHGKHLIRFQSEISSDVLFGRGLPPLSLIRDFGKPNTRGAYHLSE